MAHEASKPAVSENKENDINALNTLPEENTEHLADINSEHGSENVSHEVTIFAEPLFNIGNFTVTNSLVNSWIVVFLLVLLSVAIFKKIRKVPKGLQNFFEYVIEAALNMCDNVTGSRKKSIIVFPIVFSLFLFILINNYLGLLPGIGSIGMIANHHGELVFIPYFRGGTADLNTTLALALFAVIASNLFGIIVVGTWNYFNKFVNIKAVIHPFHDFKKELSNTSFPKALMNLALNLFIGLIKFMVGIIEIVGEIAKVASLSFRLFGNIFAGEVLLSSIAVIFAFLTPVPFMFLELIVGVVQALVFSILTLVYFTIASSEEEH